MLHEPVIMVCHGKLYFKANKKYNFFSNRVISLENISNLIFRQNNENLPLIIVQSVNMCYIDICKSK